MTPLVLSTQTVGLVTLGVHTVGCSCASTDRTSEDEETTLSETKHPLDEERFVFTCVQGPSGPPTNNGEVLVDKVFGGLVRCLLVCIVVSVVSTFGCLTDLP